MAPAPLKTAAPATTARAAPAVRAVQPLNHPLPALAGGDIVLGAKAFSNTCAACHAGGQNIVEADKTLEKEALETYLAGGFNEAAIITQVTNGKGAMPAWGGQLSPDEIKAVAAYVYDQASGDKW